MNKSLLISSFAVLTASVFGMDPGYHGESSGASHSNQLLRDIKQENPVATAPTQNFESNVQNSTDSGSNVLELMQQVLNENQSAKLEIQRKDKEIQDLRNKLASEYVTSSKLFEKLTESQNLNRRLSKINKNLTIFDSRRENNPRKRSRSVGEEEIQREFEFLHSNKLRNVISQNNKAIAEYKNNQESLKAENQELKTLLKDTATELKKIQDLQAESENTHQKEKEAREFENRRLVKTNQEKDKRIADFQNRENNLKRKLDEANLEISELKKQKNLKVFEGKDLNTITSSEINLLDYISFPNLENLAIRANQLSDILLNKPDLSKITYLDIVPDKNPLDPIELANLLSLTKNVKKLDLRNNSLISLPKEIGNLQNLKYLYIADNNLTELPKEIGNLLHLRELFLNNNSLTALPEEIGNLQNLRYLYVDDNNLTRLPAEICALPKLKELDIQNNSLEKLSKEMFVFSNIEIYQ